MSNRLSDAFKFLCLAGGKDDSSRAGFGVAVCNVFSDTRARSDNTDDERRGELDFGRVCSCCDGTDAFVLVKLSMATTFAFGARVRIIYIGKVVPDLYLASKKLLFRLQ